MNTARLIAVPVRSRSGSTNPKVSFCVSPSLSLFCRCPRRVGHNFCEGDGCMANAGLMHTRKRAKNGSRNVQSRTRRPPYSPKFAAIDWARSGPLSTARSPFQPLGLVGLSSLLCLPFSLSHASERPPSPSGAAATAAPALPTPSVSPAPAHFLLASIHSMLLRPARHFHNSFTIPPQSISLRFLLPLQPCFFALTAPFLSTVSAISTSRCLVYQVASRSHYTTTHHSPCRLFKQLRLASARCSLSRHHSPQLLNRPSAGL
jgi:hypothetical protein